MPLKSDYQFLFVGRDEGSFLENYTYDLTEEHGEKGGQIFITLEIQNNPGESEAIGEVMFDTMRKEFFADLEKESYNRFEDAVKSVNRALNKLKSEKSSHYIGNLNALIAATVGDSLFLTQAGEAEAYLVRRRFVSTVSEGLSEGESEDVFAQIANGTLEQGDRVIFSSTRLLRYVSKTDFAKLLSQNDLVQSLNDLKDALSSEILGRIALIGVRVSEVVPSAAVEKVSVKKAPVFVGKVKDMFARVPVLFSRIRTEKPQGVIDRAQLLKRFTNGGWTKDKILASLIVVILLLTLGIYVVRQKQARTAEILALDEELNRVRELVANADTKGQYDKKLAGEMLQTAEGKTLEVLKSGYHRGKATEIMSLIQQTRDNLDAVKRVTNPKVLVDLSQKKDTINPIGLMALRGRLFVFEPDTLFEIVVDKVEQPLALDATEAAISGTAFDERSSLIFFSKSGKVMEVKDASVEFVDTEEGQYHKGVAIEDWSNRIYVLDPEGNKIWKYAYLVTRQKFGRGDVYNLEGDVKDGVDLAIDSAVYVLNKDGSIAKFYAGKKVDFSIVKEPFTTPKQPTHIFTEGEMSYVFVLDPGQNRIFVYLKDLKSENLVYSSQILLEGISDLRDMYFDKDANKLYVLDAKKVYEVTL